MELVTFLVLFLASPDSSIGVGLNILNVLENTQGLHAFGSWARELSWLYTSGENLTVFAFNDTGYNTLPHQKKAILMTLDAQGRKDYVRSFTDIQGRKDYVRSFTDTLLCQTKVNLMTVYAQGRKDYVRSFTDIQGRKDYVRSFTDTLLCQTKVNLMTVYAQGRKDYVRSFTVNQTFDTASLYDGEELLSVIGRRLFINKKMVQNSWPASVSKTFINGAMVVKGDIQASNGIIHVLDQPCGPVDTKNILEYLEWRTNGSRIQNLMERLSQDNFMTIAPLAFETKLTFFLPSQHATEEIPGHKMNALMGSNLVNIFQMHYIPKSAIFTNSVDNLQSFGSGSQSRVTFYKTEDKVFVRSGGVTAQIIEENIVVDNGVIHIIDRMLGFVYNNATEQTNLDARNFSQLFMKLSNETQQLIEQPANVYLFVPIDSAFDRIESLHGVDLAGNQTQIDKVVRLSTLLNGALSILSMGDGVDYNNRQRRMSAYNNKNLVIYRDKNAAWVNGGNVRARIIRPDVEVTNGMLFYIDRILGIPTMDIPALIKDDADLMRSFNELEKCQLDQYLEDPLYNGSAMLSKTEGEQPGKDKTVYQLNEKCNEQCSVNTAGSSSACQFTVFLPSETAFQNFYNQTDHVAKITQDPCRYRYVLRRHIIPNKVLSIEDLAIADRQFLKADNGNNIEVERITDNDAVIRWKQQSARVTMWDLGAINGIVHITDTVLTDLKDGIVSISPTASSSAATSTSISRKSTEEITTKPIPVPVVG